jgi:CRP-like cAMP-binding protein
MSSVANDLVLEIKEGEVIINESEESHSMYWLKSGLLAVLKADSEHEGKFITLGNINPGELFGELSFLDEQPRSATVKALTDSIVIEIPKIKYADILKTQPKWMESMIKSLVERLRKTNNKVRI